MSSYPRDLASRVLFTALAGGAGVLVTEAADWSVWWAVPFAALVTAIRSAFVDAGATGVLGSVERIGWTVAQAAASAVPVALWGVPAEYVPLIAAGLAFLKGAIAKRLGDPGTAATLPAAA